MGSEMSISDRDLSICAVDAVSYNVSAFVLILRDRRDNTIGVLDKGYLDIPVGEKAEDCVKRMVRRNKDTFMIASIYV